MYSYCHNVLPTSSRNLFLSTNQVHLYENRLASLYRHHFYRTNIKRFSILYRGTAMWNYLPTTLTAALLPYFCLKKISKIISLTVVLSLKFYVFCTRCNQVSLCNLASLGFLVTRTYILIKSFCNVFFLCYVSD